MKITKILLFLFTLFLFIGCSKISSSDRLESEKLEKKIQEGNRQVGQPAIVNFREKKQLKMLYELRDKEDLICYCYIVTITGKKVFLGKCIGYGLPYSVQFTNPEKIVRADLGQSYGDMTVPQPEPNGLFMPEGLSATWVMLIDPRTKKPRPVFVENEIIISPFKIW
jgi:hypothetical protein